jgi:hypothetical protein
MLDFNKIPTKDEQRDKLRRQYFNWLDSNKIEPSNNVQNAITLLVESFNDMFIMDIGKHKGIPELIVALIDKSYYQWYLENVTYPKNICHDLSEQMYYTLYPEEKV